MAVSDTPNAPRDERPFDSARVRSCVFALLSILLLAATSMVVVHGLPKAPATDPVALAGSGRSTDGRLSLTVTPSMTQVPAGGAPVTYTYTVTNTSQTRLFFDSADDQKCPQIDYVSGMTQTDAYSYLEPGQTATFTCMTLVSQNITGTATFTFYEDGGLPSTVQATDSVTVLVDPAKGQCTGELWYSSFRSGTRTGTIGMLNPTGGITPKYTYPDSTTGTGSSAMASDPRNPRYLYVFNRYTSSSGGTAVSSGIYKYDTVTGTMTSFLPWTGAVAVRAAVSPTGVLWFQTTDGRLYKVDLNATTPTIVSMGIPVFRDVNGSTLTVDSGDFVFDGLGNLWLLGTSSTTNTAYLYTLSADQLAASSLTGANATLVGQMGTGTFNGLAFGSDGTLYATDGDANQLYTVDTATGSITKTGPAYPPSTYGTLGDLATCNLPIPRTSVKKTVSPSGVVRPGDLLTYTITVENTGNIPTSGSTFVDVLPGNVTYVPGSTVVNGVTLTDRAGQTGNSLFPYSVSREIHGKQTTKAGVIPRQDSVTITFKVRVNDPLSADQSRICNQGTFNYVGGGNIPTDDPTRPGSTDPTCVNAPAPALKVLKSPSGDTIYGPSSITYTYTLLNNGSEIISNPRVTDDKCTSLVYKSGDTNLDGRLGLREVWTYTCTQALSATTTNTATATGTGLLTGRAATPATATATVTLKQPTIEVTKLINGQDTTSAPGVKLQTGDTMTFTILVKNSGTAPLTAITATDPTVTGISCPATINPGQTGTCTVTRTLTAPQAGVQHTNTVTVTGRGPANPDGSLPATITARDTAWAYTEPAPRLSVVKRINGTDTTASPGVVVPEGSTMTVEYTVTNLGNGPVQALTLTDDVITTGISCQATTLAVGASTTCTATYPAPSAEKQHTNTGTARAQVPVGPGNASPIPVSGTDQAWAYVAPKASVDITKLINGVDTTSAPGVEVPPGVPMRITFPVTNTGNVTLTNIVVTDTVGRNIVCPSTTLAPGETMTCSTTVNPPAVGVQHMGTATVVGTPVASPGAPNPATVTDSDTGWAYTAVTPDYTVTKLLNGIDTTSAPGAVLPTGQSIPIRVVVRNTGNIALNNLSGTDSDVGALTCPATIPVGGTAECTGVLPALAPGVQHTDTATMSATPSPWPGNTSPGAITKNDVAWGYVKAVNSIAVVKSIDGQVARTATGVAVRNDTMVVRYRVTNTGDAALSGIRLDDVIEGQAGQTVTCPQTTLAPGAFMVCERTIDSPDVISQHHNTATVSGQPAPTVGDPTPARVTATDEAYAIREAQPAMDVIKSINGDNAPTSPGIAVVGDTMEITVQLINTGNVPLQGIVVRDAVNGGAATDVTSKCSSPPPAALAPDAEYVCTYRVPVPAFGAAGHHDVATVSATPAPTPGNPNPTALTDSDDAYAYRNVTPGISVVKRIDGNSTRVAPGVAVGDTMRVVFEITNTGNAPLTGITITDTVSTNGAAGTAVAVTDCETAPPASLAPGATYNCVVTRPAPAQGDQHRDDVRVVATAPATPAAPEQTVQAGDVSYAYRQTNPGFTMLKFIEGDDADNAPGAAVTGDTMSVRFSLRNTGDVPLTGFRIVDSVNGAAEVPVTDCPNPMPAVLQPGETFECVVSRPSPAFGAQHVDRAMAYARPVATYLDPNPAELSDPGGAYAYRVPQAQIGVLKRINGSPNTTEPGVGVTGTTMTVTFEVTNRGDAPLTGITVSDETFTRSVGGSYASTGVSTSTSGAISCPSTTLAAGDTMTCTQTLATPALGQQHRDNVTVTGTPPVTPAGPSAPVTATDVSYAFLRMTPSIGVAKLINGQATKVSPGVPVNSDTMTVTFRITNTGDAPLTQITVDDAVTETSTGGTAGAPVTTNYTTECNAQLGGVELAPGASFDCVITDYPTSRVGVLHTDTVTVTGLPPATPLRPTPTAVSASDTRNVYRTTNPGLTLLKTTNGQQSATRPDGTPTPVFVTEGQPYVVRFLVTNTGDVPMSGIRLADAVDGQPAQDITARCATPVPDPLPAGASYECEITMPAVNGVGAVVTDLATVSGTPPATPADPNPSAITATDELAVTPGVVPALAVLKLLNGASYPSGDGLVVSDTRPVSVQVRVANNGNATLTTLRVTDTVVENGQTSTVTYVTGTPGPGETQMTCDNLPATGLPRGESTTCTLTAVQPGPDNRRHEDSLVVSAFAPQSGTTITSDPTTGVVTFQAAPQASVAKLINGQVASTAPGVAFTDGSDVSIAFLVTNTGNVPLADVAVYDALDGAARTQIGSCPKAELAVGESMTCSITVPGMSPGAAHHDVATVDARDAAVAATPATLATADGYGYFDSQPGMELYKYINGVAAGTSPGVAVDTTAPLEITYELYNSGNVPLAAVGVTDAITQPAGTASPTVSCPVTTVDPGKTVTCTATIAGLQPGQVHEDTATATATYLAVDPVTGATISRTQTADALGYAFFDPKPAVTVDKTLLGDNVQTAPGTPVPDSRPLTGTFRVTNSGNVPWTGMTVTDHVTTVAADGTRTVTDVVADCPAPAPTLAPGASVECAYSLPGLKPGERHEDVVTVEATSVDRNGATVTSTATDNGFAYYASAPALRVEKAINGVDASTSPGVGVTTSDPLAVTFQVTNTGNVTVTDLALADQQIAPTAKPLGVTCAATSIAPGETILCTTAADGLAQGQTHEDLVTATGRALTVDPVTGAVTSAPVTVEPVRGYAYYDAKPAISVQKLINRQAANPYLLVGTSDPVLARVRITNTGNVDIYNVTVHDEQTSPVAATIDWDHCNAIEGGRGISAADPLRPGETADCGITPTAAGPLIQQPHQNTATVVATGTDTFGNPVSTDPVVVSAMAKLQPRPALSIIKLIDGQDASQSPGVQVQPGPLNVTVRVTNTGNVTLTDLVGSNTVVLPDGTPGGTIVCPQTTLAPGESMICTVTGIDAPPVGDMHHGIVTITGTAPGLDPGQTTTVQDSAHGYAYVKSNPGLNVVKRINGDAVASAPGRAVAPDSVMQIEVDVVNSGNTVLSAVQVTDDTVQNLVCPAAVIPVGGTITCTGTLDAPEAGVQHRNTATATANGVPDVGQPVPVLRDTDTSYAYVDALPQLTVDKVLAGDPASGVTPGVAVDPDAPLAVTIRVTNTGPIPVNGVAVTDPQIPAADLTCPADRDLAVGESIECTAFVKAPPAGEAYVNTAKATGAAPGRPGGPTQPVEDEDTAYAYGSGTASIAISKTIGGDEADTAPGVAVSATDPIPVVIVARNTGTVTLTGVQVTDRIEEYIPGEDPAVTEARNQMVANITCEDKTTLAPGETIRCTSSLKGHEPGEQHHDIASVTAYGVTVPGQPAQQVSAENHAYAHVVGDPQLTVKKTINGQDVNSTPGIAVTPGQDMQIQVVVTNTGTSDIQDVSVVDPEVGPLLTCDGLTVLRPGWATTCTAVVPAPAAGEIHHDTATATGHSPTVAGQTPVPTVSVSDEAFAYGEGAGGLEVVKKVNGQAATDEPGVEVQKNSTMAITVEITNPGAIPVTDIRVDDPALPSLDCHGVTEIAPGATVICDATVPAPPVGVLYTNAVSASGRTVAVPGQPSEPVSDSTDVHAHVPATGALVIDKYINGDNADVEPGIGVEPGTPMDISFVLRNEGDVELTNITLEDPWLPSGALDCPELGNPLRPGQEIVCRTSMPAPAVGEQHHNVATAAGDFAAAPGEPLTHLAVIDEAWAYGEGAGALEVVKKVNDRTATTAPGVAVPKGSTMTVTVEVTNTGTLPVTNLTVSDPTLTSLDCHGVTDVAPGKTITCDATTAAPAVDTQYHNVATATGQTVTVPGAPPVTVSATGEVYAYVPSSGELVLEKFIEGVRASTAPGVPVTPGVPMDVSFVVTNGGDTPVSGLTLTDSVIAGGPVSCPAFDAPLAPGAQVTCHVALTSPEAGMQHHDQATVTGVFAPEPGGTATAVTARDEAYAYGTGEGSLEVVKKVNGYTSRTAPGVVVGKGSTMTITVEVTNPGTLPVTDLKVSDPGLPALDCKGVTTVAPGQTITCEATAPAPAPDTQYRNEVTATGAVVGVPGEPATPVSAVGFVYAHVPADGSLVLRKFIDDRNADVAPGVSVTPGTQMAVTFQIVNGGDTPVTGLQLTDSELPDGPVDCPALTGPLAPGAEVTCSVSMPAPAAGQQHHDVATVTGLFAAAPGGTPVPVKATDEAYAYGTGAGALVVDKRINGDDATAAPGVTVAEGSTMNVTVSITNAGTTPVTEISATDVLDGGEVLVIACPQGELAAGASMECTFTLPAPAAGTLHSDTVRVTGRTVSTPGEPATDVAGADTAYATVPAATPTTSTETATSTTTSSQPPTTTTTPEPVSFPAVALRKLIDGDEADYAPGKEVTGDTMTIRFEVQNVGDVPLRDLSLTDDTLTADQLKGCVPPSTLAPGDSWSCDVRVPAPVAGGWHQNIGALAATAVLPDGSTGPRIESRNPANAHKNAVGATTSVVTVTLTEPTTIVSSVPTQITSQVPVTTEVTVTEPTTTRVVSTVTSVETTISTEVPTTQVVTTPITTTLVTTVPTSGEKPQQILRVDKRIDGVEGQWFPGATVTADRMVITIDVTNLGPDPVTGITVKDDAFPDQNWSCSKTDLKVDESMTCRAEVPAPKAGDHHVDTVQVVGQVAGGAPVTGRDVAHAVHPSSPVTTVDTPPVTSVTTATTTVTVIPTVTTTRRFPWDAGSVVGGGALCLSLCPSIVPDGSSDGSVTGSTGLPTHGPTPVQPSVPTLPEPVGPQPARPVGEVPSPGAVPQGGSPQRGYPQGGAAQGTSRGGQQSGGGQSQPAARGPLASTGASVIGLAMAAPILMALGLALVALARRRSRG